MIRGFGSESASCLSTSTSVGGRDPGSMPPHVSRDKATTLRQTGREEGPTTRNYYNCSTDGRVAINVERRT